MSLFFAKGCRRSRRWQILCIYTDNELKAVLVRGPGDCKVPVHEKVLEKNEKTLEKGGRVVYNGGKW